MDWDHVSIPTELGDRLLAIDQPNHLEWLKAVEELTELIKQERAYGN